MEILHKAVVSFGDIKTEAMSTHRFSALMTAVGQAWSQHTVSEFKRGETAHMPSIMAFKTEEDFDLFLSEMNRGRDADDKWLTYTIDQIRM